MDKKIDWKAYRLTYTKQAKDILKMLSRNLDMLNFVLEYPEESHEKN